LSYIFKLSIVFLLFVRYSDENEDFKFDDIERLTALADSDLVSILRKLEIIKPEDSICAKIDEAKAVFKDDTVEHHALRCSSVVALEVLTTEVNNQVRGGEDQISPSMIDFHLRETYLGSDSDNVDSRNVHVADTIAY